jgi:hypothetical protein
LSRKQAIVQTYLDLEYRFLGSLIFGVYLAFTLVGVIFLNMDQAAWIIFSMVLWNIFVVMVAHLLGLVVGDDTNDDDAENNGIRKEQNTALRPPTKPKQSFLQEYGIRVV